MLVLLQRSVMEAALVVALDHIILPVADAARSVRFYYKTLGFKYEPVALVRVSPTTVLQLIQRAPETSQHLAFSMSRVEFDRTLTAPGQTVISRSAMISTRSERCLVRGSRTVRKRTAIPSISATQTATCWKSSVTRRLTPHSFGPTFHHAVYPAWRRALAAGLADQRLALADQRQVAAGRADVSGAGGGVLRGDRQEAPGCLGPGASREKPLEM